MCVSTIPHGYLSSNEIARVNRFLRNKKGSSKQKKKNVVYFEFLQDVNKLTSRLRANESEICARNSKKKKWKKSDKRDNAMPYTQS